jgi:hypothetical protein
MNNLYIYLLLGVFLYLLFTRVLESYIGYNLAQENFDPSLVPLSSIVTLAKVAQKLISGSGNGIYTNPGHLQIGKSTGPPGNLTITGNSTLSGNSTVTGTLGVTGATTLSSLNTTGNTSVGGTLGVIGGTTMSGLLTANGGISGVAATTVSAANNIAANNLLATNGIISINNGTINLTSDGTGGLYFLKSGTMRSPVYNNLYTGETLATTLTARNETTKNSYKFIPGNGRISLFANGTNGEKHIVSFNDTGSTEFAGNVNINGKLEVKSKTWRSTESISFLAQNGGTDLKSAIISADEASGYKYFGITLISYGWGNYGNRSWSTGTLFIRYGDSKEVHAIGGAHNSGSIQKSNCPVFYRKNGTAAFFIGLRHTGEDPISCTAQWQITGIM